MLIIPVIDVRGGVVVVARGGDRDGYRPIETALAPGTSDAVAVARAYRSLHPFPVLYMADLDGIAGRPANLDIVRRLARELPAVELWIDHGANQYGQVSGVLAAHPRSTVVVGSETLPSAETLDTLMAARPSRIALSLDFKGETFLGPEAILHGRGSWPERVIVMTLGAVGADAGPDLARVRQVVETAGPDRQVFAAGGVRHKGDVKALARAGAAGVLVASALHAGKMKAGDLEEIAGL